MPGAGGKRGGSWAAPLPISEGALGFKGSGQEVPVRQEVAGDVMCCHPSCRPGSLEASWANRPSWGPYLHIYSGRPWVSGAPRLQGD